LGEAVTEVKTGDSTHRQTQRAQKFSSNILWQDTALDTWHRCEDNIKNSMCVSGLDRVHCLVRVNRGGPSGSMEGTECFI